MKKTYVQILVTGMTDLPMEEFAEKFNAFMMDQCKLHISNHDGEENLVEVEEIEIEALETIDEEE